jgi:hypothetical protein
MSGHVDQRRPKVCSSRETHFSTLNSPMRSTSKKIQFQAGLVLLLSAMMGIGRMLPASAHPYQIISLEEYQQEQAKWREMIKRNPKNPEPYLQLGASHSGEAAEGYWCETAAIAVYREAIAAVPPNAELHFRLGAALVSDPAVRCEEPDPATRQANDKEGLSHLRQAIAIAAENASAETLYEAAELLIQAQNKAKP